MKFSRFVSAGIILSALVLSGSPFIASASTLTRQLEKGMIGQDVSDLQTFLAKDATIYPQGLVTGYFGFLTKSAVSNFQSRNGISSVGRVGPITLAAINSQMNSGNNNSPAFNSINVSTSNTTANINWNTDENSAAVIYYGTSFPAMVEGSPTTGVTIGGFSVLVSTSLQINHSGVITSLSPNTTYYYVLYVRDGSGNERITWPSIFHTNE